MNKNHYKHNGYKKVCENLYEVTYTEYDYNIILTPHEMPETAGEPATAGCSAIRNGRFYGRNLDVPYQDECDILVKVPAAEGRYANIGVTRPMFPMLTTKLFNDEAFEAGLDDFYYEIIPLFICDGINEKGVACNVNVCPAKDLKEPTTGTNPGKENATFIALSRLILDNAASVDEAIELLRSRNIYCPWDPTGLGLTGEEFHYMISDRNKSCVVEFINNEMVVMENENIMTNFYISSGMTAHGNGFERYNYLKNNFDMGATKEGMFELMKVIRFSDMIGEAGTGPRYSDSFGVKNENGEEVNYYNYKDNKEFLEKLQQEETINTKRILKDKISGTGSWITMHTVVFDLEKIEFEIVMHERFDERHLFRVADI